MAKKVIDTLVTLLKADGAQFSKELEKSSKDSRNWAREINKSVSSAERKFAGMAAAAGASLTLLARQGLKSGDEAAKTADKLGIMTEELRALQLAADLTDAGDQLNTALQRMIRRVSEAADGTGEAKNALAELGLEAQKLEQQSPDEQFRSIAEAMQDVDNQSDRVRLAMRLFDSEGVALVNTLALGREGLDAIREEAFDLGIAFDRVDLAKIELANDELTRVKAVSEAFSTHLAVGLSPVITAVSGELLDAAKGAGGFGDISVTVGELAVKAIGAVADTWDDVTLGIKQSQAQLANFLADALEFGASIDRFFSIDGFHKGLAESAKRQEDAAKIWRDLGETYGAEYEQAFADRLERGKASDRLFARYQETLAELDKKANAIADSSSSRSGGISSPVAPSNFSEEAKKLERQAAQVFQATRTATEQYAAETARLNKLLDAGKISQDTFNRAMAQASEELNKNSEGYRLQQKSAEEFASVQEFLKTDIERVNEAYDRRIDVVRASVAEEAKAADLIAELNAKRNDELKALADEQPAGFDAIFGEGALENLFSDFENIESNFKGLIIRMVAEAAQAQILQGLGMGTGGMKSFTDIGSIVGSFFGGARADGGPVSPDKTFLVGERGPEMFVPNTAGRIVPNHELGGGGVTVNMTVKANDPAKFQKAQRQLAYETRLAASGGRQ